MAARGERAALSKGLRSLSARGLACGDPEEGAKWRTIVVRMHRAAEIAARADDEAALIDAVGRLEGELVRERSALADVGDAATNLLRLVDACNAERRFGAEFAERVRAAHAVLDGVCERRWQTSRRAPAGPPKKRWAARAAGEPPAPKRARAELPLEEVARRELRREEVRPRFVPSPPAARGYACVRFDREGWRVGRVAGPVGVGAVVEFAGDALFIVEDGTVYFGICPGDTTAPGGACIAAVDVAANTVYEQTRSGRRAARVLRDAGDWCNRMLTEGCDDQ